MEENKELNLNDSSKNKIKTDRKINSKNLIKAIVILVGFIVVVAMSISFFFGGDKKEEVKEEEIGFQEKNVGELEEKNYGNSRVQEAIEEKINEEEIIEETYEPEEQEETDPYEEFMKEMELDKLKRHYEAKKSPFNSSSKKISSDSSSSLEAMKYDNPDAAKYGSSYGNSSEYMNYITAGIGGSENPNMQKEKKAWLKNAAINNFVLQKPLIPSISKYEVKAGTYIPITLIPSINSDIPGTFSALVREDVYDTNTGTIKLIPMGTKLFGQFNSEVSWGQERLQAVFNRLTLPNGKSINLDSMGAADLEGQSGLTGKVNAHIGKVIGSVIMAGVVGATEGVLSNNGNSKKDQNRALNEGASASGRKGLDIVDNFTNKILNVQPTITVKAGARATLVVDKDILLEEYNKDIYYLQN